MNVESVSIGMFNPSAETEANASGLSREDVLLMYTEYAGSVYNYFFYSLGDKVTAEDLVSDVFVKIIGKSGRYNSQKGEPKVWLFAVARNTLRDYLKIKRREKPLFALDEVEKLPAHLGTEQAVELKIETLALIRALGTLCKRERTVVSFKYGAGLRNKDIAKLMGLSEKNTGVILCRTLSKLRKQLGDDFCD